MLTELSSPFQTEVAEGIDEELQTTPYQEIIVAGSATPDRQKRSIDALIDRQVDGVILIAPFVDTEWLEALAQRIPTVVVARHGSSPSFDSVVDDDFEGARLMVDHLVRLGHRRIAHTGQVSGGLERPFILSQTARLDGYEQAMRRHGLTPDVVVTSYSESGGHEAAIDLLDRPNPPTAIFAGADIAALGVLRAAEERGISVPEQLTVTGYDNIYVSTIGRVSLTTVDQSGHLTGSRSARLLLERLEGRKQPIQYVIAPRLVVRNTSGPPAEKAAAPRTGVSRSTG